MDTWAGPSADCPCCLVPCSSRGNAQRVRRGWGRIHPAGSWLCPPTACSLQPLGASLSCEPGGCQGTQPQASSPQLRTFSPCSTRPSCLPRSSCQAPWPGASGESLPKHPGGLAPPAALLVAPTPSLHWALSAEAGRVSNWVPASSWQWLWGV